MIAKLSSFSQFWCWRATALVRCSRHCELDGAGYRSPQEHLPRLGRIYPVTMLSNDIDTGGADLERHAGAHASLQGFRGPVAATKDSDTRHRNRFLRAAIELGLAREPGPMKSTACLREPGARGRSRSRPVPLRPLICADCSNSTDATRRPLLIRDSAALPLAERAGVEAVTWRNFLVHGLPRAVDATEGAASSR